jgi:phosphate starvation-inducible PhoH-like protein
MSEKIINLNNLELVKLFGTNNTLFNSIKNLFPEIKIVSRGENIIVKGSKSKIIFFEKKLSLIINHINHYNSIDINSLEKIVSSISSGKIIYEDDIILHGVNGKTIKARTENQRKIKSEIDKKDLVFAIGPAGTGKTYTAVALAVKALKNKTVKRIIFTRPAVEAGEDLGFLPGDLKEKLDPYMQPIYDALFDMIHIEKLNDFINDGTIQIAPLAFMRGRTLDKAFVILDEGQNTTIQQMKMFLTRMGKSAKFIITGDETQVDLPKNKKSGLAHAKMKLSKIKEISFIHLDNKDVIRHNIVTKIINEYKKDD